MIPSKFKESIYKALPKAVYDRVKRKVASDRRLWLEQQERQLPVYYRLEATQLQNCRLLPDRMALLGCLPKYGIVAELGVDTGAFSQAIWETCLPEKLHLVDAWDTPRYGEDKAQGVERRFAPYIANGKVKIHRGYSTIRAIDFPDGYFDWLYIDTDHSYETTRQELALYAPKMKPCGIIAGHDYIKGNWMSGYRYGVMEAVYEFCAKEQWELLYLTTELDEHPSFAIRKME